MKLLAKTSWVETKLFLRDPLAVVFTFAFPLFMLVVLAGVFGNELETGDPEEVRIWRGVGPTDYYVPAYVALVIASTGVIVVPQRLASYRERGVLRRFFAAGFPLSAVIGAQVAVAIILSLAGAAAVISITTLVYGAALPESWPGVLAAWVLGLASFTAVGLALGAVLPTSRAAQGAGLILFFVMMLIGGSGPPREVMPESLQAAAGLLPHTYVVLTLQEPWLGFGWDVTSSLVLAGFGIAGVVVAVRYFRWG